MEYVTDIVRDIFFILPPDLRGLLVFGFSYAEGLPLVGSLLPGGTIALLVGSLSTEGYMAPFLAVSIIAVGSFLGDITGFFVGKRLKGTKLLQKMVAQEKHQKSWELFDRNLAVVLVLGKLIPVVRSTPSFFAGARNIPFARYALWSALGSVLWAFAGIYGGSFLSRTFGSWAVPLILGILVVSAFVALISNKRRRRPKRAA